MKIVRWMGPDILIAFLKLSFCLGLLCNVFFYRNTSISKVEISKIIATSKNNSQSRKRLIEFCLNYLFNN